MTIEIKPKSNKQYQKGYHVFNVDSWSSVFLGKTTKDVARKLDDAVKSIVSQENNRYVLGLLTETNTWSTIADGKLET